MSTPQQKLADSLDALRRIQETGAVAIRGADLSRTHRERLQRAGRLFRVMKGWYLASEPGGEAGESTAWFTAFWGFCRDYLRARFGEEWCLSPQQSLRLHAGQRAVPEQLVVRAPRARNRVTALPFGTSLLDLRAALPPPAERVRVEGLVAYGVPAALIACPASEYRGHPTEMRAALALIGDAAPLLEPLLDGGHSAVAGRLAGALRNVGRGRVADEILATMRAAGYDVREQDPFEAPSPVVLSSRGSSPHVERLRVLWHALRDVAVRAFPAAPGLPADPRAYLATVEERYVDDAYHSMSIEGYRVSRALIEQVRAGGWDPARDAAHREHRDALVALGYQRAFRAVQRSIEVVLAGAGAGATARADHGGWFRELFGPLVTAGLLAPGDLAGYRRQPVYIRMSRHVPPRHEALAELMPALFDLLEQEREPAARAVLGHFAFVYVHPYMDGNGRLGRFLMNTMLAAGGYPWTVVPVEQRDAYMTALERASVHHDIGPFARLLGELVTAASVPGDGSG